MKSHKPKTAQQLLTLLLLLAFFIVLVKNVTAESNCRNMDNQEKVNKAGEEVNSTRAFDADQPWTMASSLII